MAMENFKTHMGHFLKFLYFYIAELHSVAVVVIVVICFCLFSVGTHILVCVCICYSVDDLSFMFTD